MGVLPDQAAAGLSVVEGRSYGPFSIEVSAAKVAEFVAATGDDAMRWRAHAPPGFAASILFEAAPAFFADEAVHPYLAVLIHTEQQFEWTRPLPVGARLDITGTVTSVRERGGMFWVRLLVEAVDGDGPVVVSNSTFMMARDADVPEALDEGEPAAGSSDRNDPPSPRPLPAPGGELPSLHKSASRLDLVRYAAASRDFNPIHWDHDSARSAGLEGVIAHGLLMGAWIAQAAARVSPNVHAPLESIRLRFRKPLRPAAAAIVAGSVGDADGPSVPLRLALSSGGVDLVTATASIRNQE